MRGVATDPDLAALEKEKPRLFVSQVKKVDSGIQTNRIFFNMLPDDVASKTNVSKKDAAQYQVRRWVLYALVDGDIAWRYYVQFMTNGVLDSVDEMRVDGKEFDPRYKKAIEQANHDVEAEMKLDGTQGKLGSIRHFWWRKKELLKLWGIEWRAPDELNPGTSYD